VLIAPSLNFPRSRWDVLDEDARRRWCETGRLRVGNQWLTAEIGYGLVEEADEFTVGRLAAELARPLLILHGLRDEVVPYPLSLAFVELAAHPDIELRLFKDGDHRLTAHKEEVAEAACDFFAARHHGPAICRTPAADSA
jgi:pimeloyl-ACP methyl ester carboxylesterase